MGRPAIKIENVSKRYRLGEYDAASFRRELAHRFRAFFPAHNAHNTSPCPGSAGDTADASGYIWALQHINLEILEGDIVGIIGKNGAGKSTLLKIISRITTPTEGQIKIRGKIGSLLEVGTGMHPDMTARENIYMNGTILGIKKHEINRIFDDIIDFAGCSLFVNTPIKHFSTGMRMRLGFAVAAFMNPEILIVDEVLAVGDAEFQRRCLGKINEITSHGNRTLLFVSHNIATVKNLCNKGVLLRNGRLHMYSNIDDVVAAYRQEYAPQEDTEINLERLAEAHVDGFRLTDIVITNSNDTSRIVSGEDLIIIIRYEADRKYSCPAFVVQIKDDTGLEIIRLSNMPISGYEIRELYEEGVVTLKIDPLQLVKGLYFIDIGFVHEKVEWHFKLENVIRLYVDGNDIYKSGLELDRSKGLIWARHAWKHERTIAADKLSTDAK